MARCPIFAVAWATYLLRRLPGWRQLIGIGIGFAGIVLVFIPELQASPDTTIGAFVALSAIVFYGLATNLAVPLQQKYGAPPVIFARAARGALLVLPLGLWQLQDATCSWESALAMVPLGALGTGLAIVLMATLAGRVGAPRASIAIYFLPVVAVVARRPGARRDGGARRARRRRPRPRRRLGGLASRRAEAGPSPPGSALAAFSGAQRANRVVYRA